MENGEPQKRICERCKAEIPDGATKCPKCKKTRIKWAVLIVIITIGVIGVQLEGNNDEKKQLTEGENVENSLENKEADYEKTAKELFEGREIHYVKSLFLYDNSEYYAGDVVMTLVSTNAVNT